jgi:restriction endonuclease S subunit
VTVPFVKIKDVCDFVRGLTYSKSDEVELSRTAVLRATNIDLRSNRLNLDEIRYIDDSVNVKPDKKVKVNDILICTASGSKSHLGKVALIEEPIDMAFGGFMGVLRTKPNILPKYLFTFLKSEFFIQHVFNTGDGANINNLKFSQFEGLEIPLPPLATQQKIVAKLDAIFAEIDKATAAAEANTKNAEALFQSYLTQVYGDNVWNRKKLKECCSIKPSKNELKKCNSSIEVSFMPMESLGINTKFATANKTRKLSEVIGSYTYFAEGDVLLAKITPCFENGKLGIAHNLVNGIGFGSSEYVVLRANNEEVDPSWLYYFLNREEFRAYGAKHMAGAVGHKRVTKDFIEESELPLPSISEQKQQVVSIEKVFSVSQSLRKASNGKVIELKNLKNSILKQAFSGELVGD